MGAAAIAGTVIGNGITLYSASAHGGAEHGHDHGDTHDHDAPAADAAGAAGNTLEVPPKGKARWGMIIDNNKCTAQCTACTAACRTENNVPYFGDERYDGHWIRKVTLTPDRGGPEKHLPLLCNHCEQPPCQHVCPVAATFTRHDGIVMIDKHRCIGCRYCMIACPYKARTFVFKETTVWTNPDVPKRGHGVVEKCTFCAHRIDHGTMPACVEACNKSGEGAMIFGDLNNPESAIVKYIRAVATKGIREDLGLEPKVFYTGI